MDSPPHPFPADDGAFDTTESKLLRAAFFGDLRRFKRLAKMLDMGRGRLKKAVEEVRMEGLPGFEGYGALHTAASNNVMVICRYLVEKLQVDVDAVDDLGQTPLFIAAINQRLEIVKYLLDHGANQDQPNCTGLTPLHPAAGKGQCEMVKLLLDKGAYVDPVSAYGTPLHIAATEGQDGAMKILLEHGADCDMRVNDVTPLLVAMGARSHKCVNLLVEAGANVDESLSFMRSAFVDSANNDSTECLNFPPEEDKPVGERIAELKSLGRKATEEKDYHSAAGFYSKALLDARKFRNKRPDWPKAYYRQGAALMLLKDYVSAAEALYDGFKLDPGNTEIGDALREAMESLMMSQST